MFVPFNPTFSCNVPLSAMCQNLFWKLDSGYCHGGVNCKINLLRFIYTLSLRHISNYIQQQVYAYSTSVNYINFMYFNFCFHAISIIFRLCIQSKARCSYYLLVQKLLMSLFRLRFMLPGSILKFQTPITICGKPGNSESRLPRPSVLPSHSL